jgi:hypothetical protein
MTMNSSNAATPFQAIFGMIILVSYVVVILLVARLKHHVDVVKLQDEGNARRLVKRAWFPPVDLLTAAGRKRRTTAIALFAVTIVALIVLSLHEHKW